MRALNLSRGSVLMERGQSARSFWARGLGLMGRAGLPPGGGLVLEPANSIHMFFMRIPLDVVFLDREGRVLLLLQGLRPWRVSPIVRGARRVLELPQGMIAASRTQVGDRVELAE